MSQYPVELYWPVVAVFQLTWRSKGACQDGRSIEVQKSCNDWKSSIWAVGLLWRFLDPPSARFWSDVGEPGQSGASRARTFFCPSLAHCGLLWPTEPVRCASRNNSPRLRRALLVLQWGGWGDWEGRGWGGRGVDATLSAWACFGLGVDREMFWGIHRF